MLKILAKLDWGALDGSKWETGLRVTTFSHKILFGNWHMLKLGTNKLKYILPINYLKIKYMCFVDIRFEILAKNSSKSISDYS